jgi:hypothetical protein
MLKEQSNEIFYSYFQIKRYILVPIDMSRSNVEFCQILVKLLVLELSIN